MHTAASAAAWQYGYVPYLAAWRTVWKAFLSALFEVWLLGSSMAGNDAAFMYLKFFQCIWSIQLSCTSNPWGREIVISSSQPKANQIASKTSATWSRSVHFQYFFFVTLITLYGIFCRINFPLHWYVSVPPLDMKKGSFFESCGVGVLPLPRVSGVLLYTCQAAQVRKTRSLCKETCIY